MAFDEDAEIFYVYFLRKQSDCAVASIFANKLSNISSSSKRKTSN